MEEQRCAPLPHFGQFVLTWVKPGVFIPVLEGDSMGVTPRGDSFKVGGILPPVRNYVSLTLIIHGRAGNGTHGCNL